MFKKSIFYIVIVYFIQLLNVVLNILLIRNLSLEYLGQITLAKVYFQFMDYTHLGSRFAMDRYVPTANEIVGREIAIATSIVSFIISVIVIAFVYLFTNNDIIVFLFMLSGAIFAQGTIYKAFYRAKEKTTDMIMVVLITMFFPVVFQIIAISFFDFKIYILTYVASYIFGFIFLNYQFKLMQYISIEKFMKRIKSLFNASILLFITSLVIFLSFSIDKILMENYNGSEALGEYSIILFVFATLLIIPGTLAELVFPKIMKKVKATSKVFYLKETAFVFLPTLFAIIAANLLMDYFIKEFTEYSYLLHYLHLVSWGVLPYSFISIFYHTLNALDLRLVILKINIFTLIFYVVYLYLSLKYSSDVLELFIEGRILYPLSLMMIYFLYLKFFMPKRVA